MSRELVKISNEDWIATVLEEFGVLVAVVIIVVAAVVIPS